MRKVAVSTAIVTLVVLAALAATLYDADLIFNERVGTSVNDHRIAAEFLPEGMPPPTEWNKTYGGPGWDVANSVIETSDAGYMLAGYTESHGAGYDDFWLVKTNSAGRGLWNRTYGGPAYDEACSLLQTSDGGYVIAGYTESYGNGSSGYPDVYLVKIDSSGRQVWDQPFGGLLAVDSAESIKSIEGGGFAVAGAAQLGGNASDQDFWLITTNNAGDLNWDQTYGGSGYDHSYSVVKTADGGFVLVGDTFSYGVGSADMWLVKVEGSIPLHNIAVIDVTPSKTVVGQGYSLSISVTVENLGNRAEAFNASAYANTIIVDSLSTLETIMPGNVVTLVFVWDTNNGDFLEGGYTISADVILAPPTVDLDPMNNSLADGVVHVSDPGDIDGNGRVNVFDLFALGKAYASHLGDSNWNANCDVDSSNAVDALDLSLINENYGKSP